MISPSVHVYDSPTHDPIATCVVPAGLPYVKNTMGSGKLHGHSPGDSGLGKTSVRTAEDTETIQESGQQLFPPDEPSLLTKSLSNGQIRSFAGTVTLMHVPSLPLREPPRFPLDDPMTTVAGTPMERGGDAKPQLYGLGTIHPGLIERNNPPPMTGWSLDVPLDDDDAKYESWPIGDVMQVDDSAASNTQNTKNKGKEPEESIKVRLQTAALGMGGKVILVIGTRGRIWVYRMKSGQ